MKETTKPLMSLILSVSWIAGVVLAQGYLKIAAALLPPYAWYLLIERLMKVYGII
jgi:hypothetical protein